MMQIVWSIAKVHLLLQVVIVQLLLSLSCMQQGVGGFLHHPLPTHSLSRTSPITIIRGSYYLHMTMTNTASQRTSQRSKERPLSQRWYRAKQQHLSKRQKTMLQQYWSYYGKEISYEMYFTRQSLLALFPSTVSMSVQKVCLDVGFGNGDALLARARLQPDCAFIGIEIHRASIANVIEKLVENEVENVRIFRIDAADFLRQHCDPTSRLHLPSVKESSDVQIFNPIFDEMSVYFPDPWPNEERDAERRIIRHNVLDSLERVLMPEACLHVATDVFNYSKYVQSTMKDRFSDNQWQLKHSFAFSNVSNPNVTNTDLFHLPHTADVKVRLHRPVITKYESKALESGSGVIFDLFYDFRRNK